MTSGKICLLFVCGNHFAMMHINYQSCDSLICSIQYLCCNFYIFRKKIFVILDISSIYFQLKFLLYGPNEITDHALVITLKVCNLMYSTFLGDQILAFATVQAITIQYMYREREMHPIL